MRTVASSVTGRFDAVIAFDNSVPHLQSDDEIVDTFRGMTSVLTSGGVILISVRDYGLVDRAPTSYHSYGERRRGEHTFRIGQEWQWLDTCHYETTMIIERNDGGGWRDVLRTGARYYAVLIERLLTLLEEAGLRAERVDDIPFFQPVLRGRAG
jgi:hypothetical protein